MDTPKNGGFSKTGYVPHTFLIEMEQMEEVEGVRHPLVQQWNEAYKPQVGVPTFLDTLSMPA